MFLGYVIQFVILFLVCFLYYRLIALKSISKKNNKEKNKELPEVRLFILLNNLDMRKVKYLKLAKQISNIICFDLALTVVLGFNLSENIFARIGICILVLLITTVSSYKLLGIYYRKKGLIKDVQS